MDLSELELEACKYQLLESVVSKIIVDEMKRIVPSNNKNSIVYFVDEHLYIY